jgi:hypothetical protein
MGCQQRCISSELKTNGDGILSRIINIILVFITFFMLLLSTVLGQQETIKTYKEGIFILKMPSKFIKISCSRIDVLKKQMLAGSRSLANESGLGDPDAVSVDFFSAFSTQGESVLIILQGYKSDVVMDYDNMYETNKNKIRWGIDNGKLSRNSKGISKTKIDDIPTLLMDIEFPGGLRQLTYIFYPPTLQENSFSVGIMCNTGYYSKYQTVLNDFISSIKVRLPVLKE